MKTITIVSNCIKDEGLKIAERVKNSILKLSPETLVRICEMENMNEEYFRDTEMILVLGGDGTMLRVSRDTCEYAVPVLGINLGNIGFLTEVDVSEIDEAMEKLLAGDMKVEDRLMLSGSVFENGAEVKNEKALNDVTISGYGDIQVIGYRLMVNDHFLNDFFADGIIISTPTGSTGYNLSAGGPIVEPPASLMVVTPVNPHTLSTRSIILSDKDKVEIKILPSRSNKPLSVAVYFDGIRVEQLREGDSVVVTKARQVARLCRLSDETFLEMLHRKLS